ncbi:MAG: sigma factor-like helix-turn-helix DNA-binding protein, partial [Janthinobacterium lividum]
RVWDHAADWKPVGGGLPGWLRRIATNLSLDRHRRSSRISDADVPEHADPALAVDKQMDAARLGSIAQTALLALPDRQRAAIVLTYYEQLANAAAAEAMAMNVKAFESLLVRARSALRAAVQAAGVSATDLEVGA